jgi:predicted dehydrogenase
MKVNAPLNRRDFARLSALALASTQLRSFAQAPAPSQKPVGFAVVGLGTISDIFMRACAKIQTAKITALVTGHPDTKGKHYAEMYGIPQSSIYTYEAFDRIKNNKDIEAVYIGLPNSMHREFTIRGAQAGKHVLCEKPMAISSAECNEMISACRKANVKLMIGYRVHYDPIHLVAQHMVQSGAVGEIQSFEGAFGYMAAADQWRLTRKYAGGGPLMDVGIYPMNEIRWLLGEEPVAFNAVATTRDHASGRFAEMEQTLTWTMKFPSGIVAALGCTYGSEMPSYLRIHGDKGWLEIADAYKYSGVHLLGSGPEVHADLATLGDDTAHFQTEADHFATCIRTGTQPNTPGEEGLRDLLAMEAIYKAAGSPIA